MPLTPAYSENGSYFHCTTPDRVLNILSDGLRPGKKRRWVNAFGKKLGTTNAVYLISRYHEALQWAAKMSYDHETEIVIMKVQVSGALTLDECIESQMAGNRWFTVPSVPEEDILGITPLTLDMKRGLVQAIRDGEILAEPACMTSEDCTRSRLPPPRW
jgi:hypothetical protein